ncbi:MAG: hypothetical protein JWO30_273 [Fibrobacteres bacterium]|nr:hypothetical protein [Fibrobacterota bacterium]
MAPARSFCREADIHEGIAMAKHVFILLVPVFFASAHGQEVRAQARSAHNLFIGIGPAISIATEFKENSTAFLSPGTGLSLGYRRHFRKRLGFKAESQIAFGPTYATFDSIVAPANGRDESIVSSGGWGGQTILFNAGGALVIGPFGRFNFEPGLGVAWGRHTVDSIGVRGSAGDMKVSSERILTSVNYSVALSLLLGKKDEYDLGIGQILGFNLDPPGGPEFLGQFYLRLSYAFQFPDG